MATTTRHAAVVMESGEQVMQRIETAVDDDDDAPGVSSIVLPGRLVTQQPGFMRGKGTYPHDDVLVSCMAGAVQQVNKLVTVNPIRQRYVGEVGDVIVGRITEVQQKRWKVHINSRLDSSLQLSAVNLVGGELRRKSLEDELRMREYLQEGDLISAEVQQVMTDGSIQLHTRSLKYGKLSQGVCVSVPSALVARRKTHFVDLPQANAHVVLGNNGMVFIGPRKREGDADTGGYVQNLDRVIPLSERSSIARVHNACALLGEHALQLSEQTIMLAISLSMDVPVCDMLEPTTSKRMADRVRVWLKEQ